MTNNGTVKDALPDVQPVEIGRNRFFFFKGAEDLLADKGDLKFDSNQAAGKVREHLSDAMNARNVSFLLGSGCSSLSLDGQQVGIPTMKPLAESFLGVIGEEGDQNRITNKERTNLKDCLGIDIGDARYKGNLEHLMEVLYSLEYSLKHSHKAELKPTFDVVQSVISKTSKFITLACSEGRFNQGEESVVGLYQAFYRKLIYRDRALPRPWVFTTNYDLFNETAMDRLGIPYCNGFSGTIERRFNPSTFRYSLAEQLDITSRKWSAVDNFVYLAKLHGSVSWIEKDKGLFPICEVQKTDPATARVMIYPTPAKQNASFASPYSDLFREFQTRVVRDQSVLFSVGYSFGDEHVNNIIFQALTVPTFRLVAFVQPKSSAVAEQLRALDDPRIWIIGGDGQEKAHYFQYFIEKFMPEPPGDKIDTAISKVLRTLVAKDKDAEAGNGV